MRTPPGEFKTDSSPEPPQAITQTSDGYLWIGTEGGLVRFDGVRFVPWTAPPGKQLPSTRVHSLLGASDGSLWIGTNRGLAKWKDLDLTDIESTPAFIEAIVQDPKGTIWVTRSQVRDDAGRYAKRREILSLSWLIRRNPFRLRPAAVPR